ncbi:Protease HtpX [uncultured archaeon]|nr:Protease HtpX [uncultured archaeon]
MKKQEPRISFYNQISTNKWKSFFLILIVFMVFIVLGAVIGLALGPDYFTLIMIAAIIISIIYVWVGYYYSADIALASVNAKPADRRLHKGFYDSVEGLTLASGMPMPKLYVMDSSEINAFASGRDPKNAVICVTSGALERLDKQELEGVLGHELSHVANYDIRFMTLVAVLVGMIAIVSEIFLRSLWFSSGNRDDDSKGNAIFMVIGIILAILAPIVVQLVQLAVSRKREYMADASAVKFIRSPTGLIGALKKIEKEHVPDQEKQKINKAVAPLFISDPFKRKIQGLFSTHPPIEKRIEILERM